MAAITARIRVARSDAPDTPFFFATDLEELKKIDLKHDTHWYHTDISTGSVLVIEGREYRVARMLTTFHDAPAIAAGEHGIHTFGHADRHPYNFEITYYVAEVG